MTLVRSFSANSSEQTGYDELRSVELTLAADNPSASDCNHSDRVDTSQVVPALVPGSEIEQKRTSWLEFLRLMSVGARSATQDPKNGMAIRTALRTFDGRGSIKHFPCCLLAGQIASQNVSAHAVRDDIDLRHRSPVGVAKAVQVISECISNIFD